MLGNIIGGIAGGIITNKGQRDANRTNQENHMREIANRDLHAKNRIQWMAKDAQAAGISPLAALGGGLPAFSPVAAPQQQNALRGMGQAVQNAGKSIQSPEARQQQANLLQNQSLQNKLLATQIAGQQIDNGIRSNQMTQTTDPIPGQPDSAQGIVFESHGPGRYVDVNNAQITANHPGSPLSEAGSHPDTRWTRGPNGSLSPQPSEMMTEVMESNPISTAVWELQNRLSPNEDRQPPQGYLPEGKTRWEWNHTQMRWDALGPNDKSLREQRYDTVVSNHEARREALLNREKEVNAYLAKFPTWMSKKIRAALKNSPGKNMRHTR